MFLSKFSVKHPVIIIILCCAVLVFGVMSAFSMNQEMFPDVSSPEAFILTMYPGMSSSQIEKNISEKLEKSFEILSDIKSLRSQSMESVSLITISFNDDVSIYDKVPEIREKINMAKSDLPADLPSEPIIIPAEGSTLLPIYSVKVSSDMDRDKLQELLEDRFIPKVKALEGISSIKIQGAREEVVKIELDIDKMVAKGISVLDVYGLLQYFNISMPGGGASFQDKSMTIRTQGRFSSLSEIQNLTIGYKDSSKIYLKDIAIVSFGFKPPDTLVLSDSKPVFALDVFKKVSGNTIKIVEKINQLERELSLSIDGNVEFNSIADQSKSTEMSISTVLSSAFLGVIFAIIIIYLFLRSWRSTLIIACSLPLSILITALGMFLTGKTLNILTLSGLTVAIGMIVDCSIVVLENIHNYFTSGKDRVTASIEGAEDVAGAVLASTTTSVSVFLPLAFLTGIIGIVMKDLSITIVIALIASAIVSVVIVPFLASIILKEDSQKKAFPGFKQFDSFMDKILRKVTNGYHLLLKFALSHGKAFVISAVVFLLASFGLIFIMGVSFVPPTDTGELEIHISSPLTYSLEQTAEKCNEIEEYILANYPEIESSIFYVGFSSVEAQYPQKNKAIGRIKLLPYKDRKRDIHKVIKSMQTDLLSYITDVDINVLNGGFDSLIALATGGGQGFKVKVSALTFEDALVAAKTVRSLVESDEDVFKVSIDSESNGFELVTNLALDYMANLGVTPREAGAAARIFFYGLDVGEFVQADNKQYPLFITSNIAGKEIDSDTINRIALISSQSGRLIPFSSFSQIKLSPSIPVLKRDRQLPVVEVTGYLTTTDIMGISSRMKAQFANLNLPDGVQIKLAGISDLLGNTLSKMVVILIIALFLVYMVMVIQFEEFTQPLIIMFSIPFCFIGVIFGLLLFGSDLNLFAMLGIVALAGIVVNNAIVMVDYFNLMRKKDPDSDLRQVVIEGATCRLQPILMTTLTTLFGVLPMCFAKGNGAALYAPLGQAIAGGLVTSSLISLFLIPILYHWLEKKD